MLDHYEQESNHCIALGIGDLSFWCYKCDSYINHLTIKRVLRCIGCVIYLNLKKKVPKDLVKQYSEYDEDQDDKKDDEDDYELYINMELELKQIKLKMTNPQNSLIIIDELIGTFNHSSNSNTYLYYDENMILHNVNKQTHENPDRIIKSIELLSQMNLLNKCNLRKSILH